MGKTIMVVDDERVFHDLYTEMLDGAEYRLIHVYDGDEGVAGIGGKKNLI